MGELIKQDVRRVMERRVFVIGLAALVACQLYVLFATVIPMGYGFAEGVELDGTYLPVPAMVVATLGNMGPCWIVLPGICSAWLAQDLRSGYADVRRSWGMSLLRQAAAALCASTVAAVGCLVICVLVLACVSAAVSVNPFGAGTGAAGTATRLFVSQGMLYDSAASANYARDLLLPLLGSVLSVAFGDVLALVSARAIVVATVPAVLAVARSIEIGPLAASFAIGTRTLDAGEWAQALVPTAVATLLMIAVSAAAAWMRERGVLR